jgi:hypothetical protein
MSERLNGRIPRLIVDVVIVFGVMMKPVRGLSDFVRVGGPRQHHSDERVGVKSDGFKQTVELLVAEAFLNHGSGLGRRRGRRRRTADFDMDLGQPPYSWKSLREGGAARVIDRQTGEACGGHNAGEEGEGSLRWERPKKHSSTPSRTDRRIASTAHLRFRS